jgi:predicted DNA-binding transcriptional regulator AlpA
MLGISRSKFHLLVRGGSIPRLKLGRCARYRRTDILAFAESLVSDGSGEAAAVGGLSEHVSSL